MLTRITVLMDLPATHRFHIATVDALHHAISAGRHDAEVEVVQTGSVVRLGDAVVVGPGSPYINASAAEEAIASARTLGLPMVAT